MKKLIVTLFAVGLIMACNGIPWPPTEPAEPYDCSNPPTYDGVVQVPGAILGSYIVVLREKALSEASLAPQAAVQGVAQRYEARETRSLGIIKGFSAKMESGAALAASRDPLVAYVQEDGIKSVPRTVEAQAAGLVYGLDRVDQHDLPLDGKYEPFGRGEGVDIYVVDTGTSDHPDFGGRLQEECFTAVTFGGCADGHGHGSHVAGTVASNTYGVANKALIYSVRVLDANGSGTDSGVISGIEWAVAHALETGRPSVINMSLGGSASPALDAVVCKALEAGVAVAVAAGNDMKADACKSSPARVKQALTLGASGDSDQAAYFTNVGQCVDLFAPGEDILSTKPGGGTQYMSGTSMASPHGAGGLVLAYGLGSSLTPDQANGMLLDLSSKDKLGGVEGSPNRLLFVGK